MLSGGDKGAPSYNRGTPTTTIPLTYIKKAKDSFVDDRNILMVHIMLRVPYKYTQNM